MQCHRHSHRLFPASDSEPLSSLSRSTCSVVGNLALAPHFALLSRPRGRIACCLPYSTSLRCQPPQTRFDLTPAPCILDGKCSSECVARPSPGTANLEPAVTGARRKTPSGEHPARNAGGDLTELPTQQMRQDMFTPWRHDRGQQPWLPHPDFHPSPTATSRPNSSPSPANNLIDAELNLLQAWNAVHPPGCPSPNPPPVKQTSPSSGTQPANALASPPHRRSRHQRTRRRNRHRRPPLAIPTRTTASTPIQAPRAQSTASSPDE